MKHDAAIEAVRVAVLNADGDSDPALRRVVEARVAGRDAATEMPEPLAGYIDALKTHAYRIADEDVDALKAAGLAKFSGSGHAPIKARADLLGNGAFGSVGRVDGKIGVNDILEVLSAFSGGEYPFAPPTE